MPPGLFREVFFQSVDFETFGNLHWYGARMEIRINAAPDGGTVTELAKRSSPAEIPGNGHTCYSIRSAAGADLR